MAWGDVDGTSCLMLTFVSDIYPGHDTDTDVDHVAPSSLSALIDGWGYGLPSVTLGTPTECGHSCASMQ